MPRIARLVIPDLPHHIIQRGNRRQDVFFSDQDRQAYMDYLSVHCKKEGVSIWAWCLMNNHVHLIGVPKKEESLSKGVGKTHKEYTRRINFREKWRGYLWQGRFSSYPLDEKHLYRALRYVERNPVRAGIVKKAQDYPWSSARAHITKQNHPLLENNSLNIEDWQAYLEEEDNQKDLSLFRKHANTGRPLGSERFIEMIEDITGIDLKKKKPGRKKGN